MALQIANPLEKEEIQRLVNEKKETEEKLAMVGGREFGFLLEDCADLSDIIENIREISGKRSEKERAAFESKVKFSRKIRRKAKDLRNFEQKVVEEFEKGHIPLEHGRKMVAIIKLLRSQDVEKAEREAEEFYAFLDMGDRLKEIDDLLSRKKAQIERNARMLLMQLSDLEWLEAQAKPDAEKIGRHEKRRNAQNALELARTEHLCALSAMPLCALIANERAEELLSMGMPMLERQTREALAAFLHKSGLEGKSASDLCSMAGESEQKLRHLGIDLAGFRQEIVGRKEFLSKIMFLRTGGFLDDIADGSQAQEYLARHSNAAKHACEELLSLGGTAREDKAEWERAGLIQKKRAGLEGVGKAALVSELKEIEELKNIMEGKAAAPNDEKREEKGIIAAFFGLFKKK